MEEEKPGEEMPAEEPVEPVEPVESAAEPVEHTPEVPVEPTPMEPPKPETVRIRKPKAAAAAPSIVVPEIDDKFWATLLRTQREAERATRLQRISEFSLL